MADYLIKGETLSEIADAIRSKTGSTEDIKTKDMASSIQSISAGINTTDATATEDEIFAGKTAYTANGKVTGTFTIDDELTTQADLISQISTLVATKASPSGTDTSDATATANDILSDKTAYTSEGKVTGTMANNGAVSKTLNTSTTSYTVPSGYHNGSGKVNISLETKSVTPTKSSQAITPTSGKVLSKVIVNAIPSSYITTTDATATASDIMSGKIAYAKGSKVAGSFSLDSEISTQDNLISQIMTALEGKAAGGGSGGASVETCNIRVGVSTSALCCTYTKYDGTSISFETIVPSTISGDVGEASCYYFDLTNVVINSTIFVAQSESGTSTVTHNAELLYRWNNGRYFVTKVLGDGYVAVYD